jgi:hypothetical protein
MILDLYTKGLVALGAVSDTIQSKAMKKLSEMPNKLIRTAGDKLFDPKEKVTQKAARLYSFTKYSYALGFGSRIALKQAIRTAEDIQTETMRYIQDIQRDVTRAVEDKIAGFASDILSYIYFLHALLACLGTLFLIPLYKKMTGENIEDGQISPSSVSIKVIDGTSASPAIEDRTSASPD